MHVAPIRVLWYGGTLAAQQTRGMAELTLGTVVRA